MIHLREMIANDWPVVAQIYADGIATGHATFENTVPEYESWDAAHAKECRLVAEKNKDILGWAALTPVSSRCVYGGVGEVSVYVGKNSRGLGIGALLLQKLVEISEAEGYWTLQSGIFPENTASVQLHEKVGFRLIGRRERIGKTITGVWKDNLLFERRSKIVGT